MLRTLALSAVFSFVSAIAIAQSLPHGIEQSARPVTCSEFQRYPSKSWSPLLQVMLNGHLINTAKIFEKQCRFASPDTPLRAVLREPHSTHAGRRYRSSDNPS